MEDRVLPTGVEFEEEEDAEEGEGADGEVDPEDPS